MTNCRQAFAKQVIKDQTTEIAQMKKWREAWYKGAPPARSVRSPDRGSDGNASRPIRRAEELPRLTARIPVATDVELAVVRDAKELTVKVRLALAARSLQLLRAAGKPSARAEHDPPV